MTLTDWTGRISGRFKAARRGGASPGLHKRSAESRGYPGGTGNPPGLESPARAVRSWRIRWGNFQNGKRRGHSWRGPKRENHMGRPLWSTPAGVVTAGSHDACTARGEVMDGRTLVATDR